MTDDDATPTLKVGELARRCGVTVRTLHHYEQIGLLGPSERTSSGHRLYGDRDCVRLEHITTLRRAGLTTSDIASVLDSDRATTRRVLERARAEADAALAVSSARRSAISAALERADDQDDPVAALAAALGSVADVRGNRSIVVYRDLLTAYEFLADAFDLTPSGLTYDDQGVAVHAEMLAGEAIVWLHPERPAFDLFSAATLGGVSGSMAVMVRDVDDHHRRAAEHGATIVQGPVDQPYGYREYSVLDSEGHLWSFMHQLAAG